MTTVIQNITITSGNVMGYFGWTGNQQEMQFILRLLFVKLPEKIDIRSETLLLQIQNGGKYIELRTFDDEVLLESNDPERMNVILDVFYLASIVVNN